MQLSHIQEFVHQKMDGDVTGHDYWHAQRVVNLAVGLYQQEQIQDEIDNQEMLILAAYLHDTIDDKLVGDPNQAIVEVKSLLGQEGISEVNQAEILYIIEHMSFSANLGQKQPLSLVGQCVQDADRLDAIGAIGIARAFAYGGAHKQVIYDPEIQPIEIQDKSAYRNHPSTSINHFYEKLLKLKDLMNTQAGRHEAIRRTDYMQKFLQEFKDEIV
ncbi:HD domain-containing protein [Convivina praedatoris]|uniref:HD/PDEase domain-containing protein n=1 Tax=Convivina praedatoris TaxID=2880963 RepID=A0ABN8H9R6_9LACO|nr:HD domain-containing protein [Convivina sp. LMG 32447]CAH1853883.1 putative protein YedJ [Convivina sp. LMG 32447]CAH1854622.1 putative protein YedJ [Convivina sp. LMG 32447]CAH1855278.1 putative protein YedJ [Convivina sp. LMG 32447]